MKRGIDNINYVVKHWWLSLVVGVLFILLALSLMFTPIASYVALSILFSVSIFVAGIFEIIFSVANKKVIVNWGWNLAIGIIDLIIGLYLLFNPGLSMAILPYVVAFWLMFRGFSAIAYALDLKKYASPNWGWFVAFGIIAILLAIWFIWRPVIGAFSVVYFVAYIVFAIGIYRIIMAFQLRKCKRLGTDCRESSILE